MDMQATDLLQNLLDHAKRAGADAADAMFVAETSVSVQRRLGHTEHLERSESRDLGLRVFLGQRSAVVSATSTDAAGFARLAERAVAMARVVPEDPFGGLSDQFGPVTGLDALDLADTTEPDVAALIARASAAEDAARAVPGITNSEGGEAGYSRVEIALATSAGFAGVYIRTGHSISATALAGSGTDMQRDYDYSSAVHLEDLADPVVIGRHAGEKAVRRLNPGRVRTARMPVVYDPRVAGGLIGHLAAAVNGASVARGTSFLRDKMGARIFAEGIAVIDDPRRARGLRSRPFDAEGVPTARLPLVEDGVLRNWVLDSRSARQLGLPGNGHAARGTGGPPSPATTNLYLAAGVRTPAALMADIQEGLYVTELMGGGVNGITGDYSRGAAGFMIRNGVLAEPVAEITIAGQAMEIFAEMVPANDLVFRYGTDAPTVRVDCLTVAGS